MNGQLSEQPLAELIREILARSLSGRLRVEHERVHAVVYFEAGRLLYAASNLRTLRVGEYLKKAEILSDQDLAPFHERVSDTDLIKLLCSQNLLSTAAAEQIQARLIADVLRLGPGSVLELTKANGEPLDIFVNNRLVARGEVVLVEDHLGVTMTEIIKGER